MAASSIPSTSTSSPGSPFVFLSPRHRIPRQFRLPRRKSAAIRVRNQASGDDFVTQFLSNLPPPLNSFNSLSVTALTFASGLALSIPNLNFTPRNSQDWIFFSSPTPFNRFVLLRCPSIAFDGAQFLENVNEKLVKEERHYVRLHSGRIPTQFDGRTSKTEASELQYSRVCVATDDGGVIALDWPSNLELSEESGLDSTVLLIPGTADGSSEQSVKNFVCHCLNRGLFPVVINPRGCADSPLTTSRLFTAADSDDVSSAIQFLSRARPWSTFMAVGWGFGANMLTKYLAEVGEKTPLTAATCIDNPFDLEEFTRSKGSDRNLTRGLINILKSNKGLFQGRSKGFDVESALSAKSIRDFDTAISMVSYGFETLEEFYSDSSSRLMVGDIKVPVLFIQSDNTSVPLFSIPREDIAGNLFTSLLVCSSLPSNIANGKSVTMWSQELTIEWLMAVELALLKGRHPLLMDVDVTINPSKSLSIAESWMSDSDEEVDEVLDLTGSNGPNGYLLKPVNDRVQHEDDSEIELANKDTDELQDGHYRQVNGVLPLPQSGSVDAELEKDESADAVEVEGDKGQVLQTAKVVMNVLDVTMPGTLTEERKKKVLDSIDQGETLVKALQDSVPEDVRGKLTTSVSAILETQGKNFNFDAIIGQINKKASEPKVKVNGNPQGKPDDGNLDTNTPSEPVSPSHGPSDSSSKTETSSADKSPGESDDNVPSQEKSVKSVDSDEPKSKKSDELQNKQDGNESTMEVHAPLPQSDDGHAVSTTSTEQPEKPPDLSKDKSGESDAKEKSEAGKVKDLDSSKDKKNESDDAKDNGEAGEVKPLDSSKDQSKSDMPSNGSEGDSQSTQTSTDPQPSEKQDNETKNADETSVPPLNLDQNKPSSDTNASSTFNVTQAFDALTGLDDSTQVAVNSVFGAIEEVITRLEEKEEDGSTKKEEDDSTKKEEDESKGNNIVENAKDAGNGHEEVKSALDTLSVEMKENHSGVPSSTSGISDEESDQKSDKLVETKSVSGANLNDLYLMRANKTYAESVYNGYVQKFIQSNSLKKSDEHLDLDTTTDLFLDYIPEEGQWKVLEQPESSTNAAGHKKDEFMETSYVILDSNKQNQPVNDLQKMERLSEDELSRRSSSRLDDLTRLVKNVVLDTLHAEVSRKLIGIDVEEMETALARDMEEVANAVALAVRQDAEHSWCLISDTECVLEQGNGFDGAHIVETISSAVHITNCLRKMMPVGVIVGSSLASLRKFFSVASVRHDYQNGQALDLFEDDMKNMKPNTQLVEKEVAKVPKFEEDPKIETVEKKEEKTSGINDGVLSKDSVMVGAVTAALGASAFLQDHKDEDGARENSLEITEYSNKSHAVKLEEEGNGKHQNMVISLAEKAMSVAAPVVPTKEDGGVDQDRVVAMLTELGQKGGMLRMVGKLALLWGGVRGAMSLTDKLIKVLRIAQRPLLQRILAFGCMLLILWSPVAVPFLPTIVQNWTTNSSSRFAELMCTFGLYAAIAFLMVIWGKRIRGYENPLQQYGLDLKPSQNVQDMLIGLVGGVMLVISIHSVNALLGFVDLSWPSSLVSSPVDHTMKFKSWVNLVFLAGQGLVTATVIATVEELFFRSWLAEEIAVDLGDHRGIILSGLAFSLCQRSLQAIPGLWLLSLCLSGERRRKQGSLYSPIGLHAGIMASCFVLQRGGFLFYRSNLPLWMTGTNPFQPFSGIVGLLFSLVLALVLYPRQQLSHGKEMQVSMQE